MAPFTGVRLVEVARAKTNAGERNASHDAIVHLSYLKYDFGLSSTSDQTC